LPTKDQRIAWTGRGEGNTGENAGGTPARTAGILAGIYFIRSVAG
jgi:hypothetical protein